MKENLFKKLIGSWILVELIEVPLDGGEITYPMGIKPKGIIIYNNDGYMSAQIMKTDSENSDAKDNESYLAYSGPFKTDDEKQIVSHTMYVSLLESWRNQTQNRIVLFKDNLLHLETEEPFISNSRLVIHKLTWKRIEKSNKNH
ncbi:lipocalin-like domain-containing protein [Flavobacterium chungbukense]|uniref:Lipocalin-like domain-containing protein n=1 Tax=Flavobacterium chungbukense TaxID=877464 RepID=A0ABP7Y7K5_9FLAO|nr:lipocalin-like domain-containing protein [Flavobacterium chungbukense]MCC4923867.1 lipocalin-like domain-containing protein [Flavobacterium chungbukense]